MKKNIVLFRTKISILLLLLVQQSKYLARQEKVRAIFMNYLKWKMNDYENFKRVVERSEKLLPNAGSLANDLFLESEEEFDLRTYLLLTLHARQIAFSVKLFMLEGIQKPEHIPFVKTILLTDEQVSYHDVDYFLSTTTVVDRDVRDVIRAQSDRLNHPIGILV